MRLNNKTKDKPMRVLWFNTSVPRGYTGGTAIGGGWQDSLQRAVEELTDWQLVIAFEGCGEVRQAGRVTYVPLSVDLSASERMRSRVSLWPRVEKLAVEAARTADRYAPDVIHVFGTEWPFGLVAERTGVPVVVHIQGAMLPYDNAFYPPRYNGLTYAAAWAPNVVRWIKYYLTQRRNATRVEVERRVWRAVNNYMGRTAWDEAVSAIEHPGRRYFHVDEALRRQFYESPQQWRGIGDTATIRIVTVGAGSMWKGLDMMLKTARLLQQTGVRFEWHLVGRMPNDFRRMVEWKEKARFADSGIEITGMLGADSVAKLLAEATLYVHTSYIDNSPNAVCEAQLMGVPIIATDVGGVSSLVADKEDGLLVPANDPWRMAYAITTLAADNERMSVFSRRARAKAIARHDPHNIIRDLTHCYETLIADSKHGK